MIQSMTKRNGPEIINGSRRKRIAKGRATWPISTSF